MDASALEQMRDRVLSAYEQQGFASALIGSWAVSENDVGDLVASAQRMQARKILEVGTYVGVSTMMLALACPDATIYTVDPNFPLAREMQAVNAGAGVDKDAPRQQEIARRAAEILGVADRIHFVEGGFSVGDTFSSVLDDEGSRAPVVGPALCAAHGPFDFVFIDGLHTPEAVDNDLALAASALTPDGMMVLHDCIGYWGASVRRGIMSFLRRHSEYDFEHAPFADVYRSIGIVSRRASGAKSRPAGSQAPELSRSVAAFARSAFGATPLIDVNFGRPWPASSLGRIVAITLTAKASASGKPSPNLASAIASATGAGIVAIDAADFASDAVLTGLFNAAKKTGQSIFMGVTPPGEPGVAGPFSRPLVTLLDLAEATGMSLFLFPFTQQEHARYALLPQPRELGLSSLFVSFVVASADPAFLDATGRAYVRLTPELAFDHEQASLQRVHAACAARRSLDLASDEQRKRLESNAALIEQLESSQVRAAAIDEARQAAIIEFSKQTEAARDAADALRRDAAKQEKSLLAQIEAERALRLREVGELRAQVAALTEAVDQTQKIRFAAIEELTRQLNDQSAELERVRDRCTEADAERAELASLRVAMTEMSQRVHTADGTAAEFRIACGTLSRQLIETYGGLDQLERIISEQERLLSGAADLPSDVAAKDVPVSAALEALGTRAYRLTTLLEQRIGKPSGAAEFTPDAPESDIGRMLLLEQQNAALNAEIERIRLSMSWKLLGPWRIARRKLAQLTS